MREKHKNVCRALDFFQSFLVFIFVVSGCILICFIIGVPVRIASFSVGLKIYEITQRIKK